jgi:hypothetical protein
MSRNHNSCNYYQALALSLIIMGDSFYSHQGFHPVVKLDHRLNRIHLSQISLSPANGNGTLTQRYPNLTLYLVQ